ncbi:MAG: hypothetical protein IKP43_02885, partial [Bacteroidaceae bacterium]|nr:hypothetical protein [Bacteroidaceae bacterium]
MRQKIQYIIISMLFLLATPAVLTAYGQPMLTFSAQNGTIAATAEGTAITSGATVAQGTTLTFTIAPSQGYTLSSLTEQQFVFGDDAQANNRFADMDTGTDVTASAIYSASTGTYTYTCTMPANNFDVRAVFMPKPITFADPAVETLCVANWDTNHDGELDEAEAAAVTDLGEVFKGNTEITSFDELQYFTGLTDTPRPVHFALSTWKTSAKYDNIVITSDGTTLYQNDFSIESLTDWTNIGGGQWQVENGALRQTDTGMEGNLFTLSALTLGNNYTIDLDATKVEGEEGFLICFNVADANNYCWWNIGGRSNTKTHLQERIDGNLTDEGNESSQT